MTNFHETYREHDVAKASSARTFGLLMGAVFMLLALRSHVKQGHAWPWLLGIGIAFLLVAAARPTWLAPLNRMWMALGRLLNRVVSPIVLALLFLGVVWPVGVLMRLTGSDPLRLKRARMNAHESCWITRDPLANDHFTRQF
jgi:hypothetical protein